MTSAGQDAQDGQDGGQPVNPQEPDAAYLKKNLMALVGLLSRKGLVPYGEFLAEVHRLEAVDHASGQRVVARAWTDAGFKERLLRDPKGAVAELGVEVKGYDELRVVENTDEVHHVVVCTTCSCVPAPMSGFTPDWYKSAAYRTRVVDQPRMVLRELGLELPEAVDVRVIDTDARHRCMVLPPLPPAADGLSEGELADLVTQESLFGVGLPTAPVGA